ncbi:putative disease resistance protein RGA1 [Senna tora]|uniref:Putative disease resistance protein RGA1 n=1 Tax=Senna tora TaxID=362788 RepID=A0A834SXZ7_9FABA|nr:putative disease resistance protein RGA1 [Senna tora]
MAEAILEISLENLNSFARSELATLCGVNGEIKRLTKSLKLIQAVVEDAEQKDITRKPIRIWSQELKDATHVLDDILDEELSIKGLECVGNLDEAKGVNLIGIRELQVLSLSWDNSEESEIKVVGVDAEQVIEALQPFSNLKKFEVCGYKGSHFPSWMKDASCLNNLVSLSLKDCSNCVQLPALGKLPSLENLYIVNMACVEYMDDDECYDGVEVKAFISLKTLSLYNMPKLERLLKRELGGEMFPRLHKLYISKCPKLTLSCLPSVEELNILYCKEELIKSISSLRGLKNLEMLKAKGIAHS